MKKTAPYMFFAVLVCIFLWKPIFTGRALLPGDYLSQMLPYSHESKITHSPQWNPLVYDAIGQFYPWKVFYKKSLLSGTLPVTNPHQFGGTYFIANGQSSVFYPPNLIFLIFDTITAFTVFAAVHLFAAMAFTYLLAQSLKLSKTASCVCGIIFAFGAFCVLWLELPTFISVAVYLPLTLYFIKKIFAKKPLSNTVFAAFSLAMAFLAGHFQIAFYVAFACVLYFLYNLIIAKKAEFILFGIIFGVFACGIAAPQLVSSFELAPKSHRVRTSDKSGYSSYISNSLTPQRFVTAFMPDFYGSPKNDNYYLLGNINGHIGSAADYIEYGMYCAILPIILSMHGFAALKRRKEMHFFAGICILSLLLASGTIINTALYYLIPSFSSFGGPNRILLLYIFSLAIMAGCGFDELIKGVSARKKLFAITLTALLAGIAYFIATNTAAKMFDAETTRNFISPIMTFSLICFILFFILSSATCFLKNKAFKIAAILLIVVDLFVFGINANPTSEREQIYPKTKLTDSLSKHMTQHDTMAVINLRWSLFETPHAILPANAATVYGLNDAGGYDSLYLREYKDLTCDLLGEDSSPVENGNMLVFKKFTPALSKVANFVVTTETIEHDKIKFIDRADGVNIYKFTTPYKRRAVKETENIKYAIIVSIATIFLSILVKSHEK